MRKRASLLIAGLAALCVGCGPQSGEWSRWHIRDVEIDLDARCEQLITAGLVTNQTEDGTDVETKFADCELGDGTRLLQEHTPFELLEASYEFVPTHDGTSGYQGGWGSRLGGSDQRLAVPSDCANILNVGKSGSTKYIVCEAPDNTVFMRDFSDWGVFEATYVFTDEGRSGLYQGGWGARLGGRAQELPLPEECVAVRSAGRTGNTKYVDCELPNGDRMLREFTDWGVFEASYVFTTEETRGGYQGGWGARIGGKPQMLTLPEACTDIRNVGKAGSTKYVVCDTNNGDAILKEFSDWGIFEATYRFQ